jgi:5-methylcytosine-specific restriction endonuclease McrA
MPKPKRDKALARRIRAQVKKTKAACHICGLPIDYDLPAHHPMSFQLDHIKPLARGGLDIPSNMGASHRTCNSKKRAREYAPIIRRSGSFG